MPSEAIVNLPLLLVESKTFNTPLTFCILKSELLFVSCKNISGWVFDIVKFPVAVIAPVTSIPAPTSKLPATSTVPEESIVLLIQYRDWHWKYEAFLKYYQFQL